jgi:peptide/nickel transport system substrate-binding protein
MKKRVTVLVLVALLVLVFVMSLTVCSAGTGTAAPKKGGTFILALDEDPKNFFSVATSATAVNMVAAPLYPALLAYDANKGMRVVTSELAESYTFKDDKVLTFHLRKNAKWSDGKPITSADVKFTLDNFTRKFSPFGTQYLASLEKIDTPDDYTVIIKLSKPYPQLTKFFHWHYCPILPKHVWEHYVNNFQNCPAYTRPSVSGGAWMLAEYVSGSHVMYKPNPYFWKKNQPYLDKLIIKIIPDVNTQVAALEAGEIDMIIPQKFPASEAERLSKDRRFTVTTKGFELRGVTFNIFYNLEDSALSKVKVRQALTCAIDRKSIVTKVFSGYAVPLDSIMPIGPVWDKYRIKPPVVYNYNVKKANQLLNAAGYPKGANGMRNIRLTFVTRNVASIIKIGEMLKGFWKEVGVDLSVISMESAAYDDRVYKQHNFSVSCRDMGVASDFSVEGRIYRTDRIGIVNGNGMSYSNERVDWIFNNVAMQPQGKQKELYAELQKIVAKDCPLTLIQSNAPHVFNNGFGGLPAQPHAQHNSWDSVWWKKGTPIK